MEKDLNCLFNEWCDSVSNISCKINSVEEETELLINRYLLIFANELMDEYGEVINCIDSLLDYVDTGFINEKFKGLSFETEIDGDTYVVAMIVQGNNIRVSFFKNKPDGSKECTRYFSKDELLRTTGTSAENLLPLCYCIKQSKSKLLKAFDTELRNIICEDMNLKKGKLNKKTETLNNVIELCSKYDENNSNASYVICS